MGSGGEVSPDNCACRFELAQLVDSKYFPLMCISLRRAFFMERIGVKVFDEMDHDGLFIMVCFRFWMSSLTNRL